MQRQIYLSEEMNKEIKERADELGYSVSSYLVLCHKQHKETKESAGTIKGLFKRR